MNATATTVMVRSCLAGQQRFSEFKIWDWLIAEKTNRLGMKVGERAIKFLGCDSGMCPYASPEAMYIVPTAVNITVTY